MIPPATQCATRKRLDAGRSQVLGRQYEPIGPGSADGDHSLTEIKSEPSISKEVEAEEAVESQLRRQIRDQNAKLAMCESKRAQAIKTTGEHGVATRRGPNSATRLEGHLNLLSDGEREQRPFGTGIEDELTHSILATEFESCCNPDRSSSSQWISHKMTTVPSGMRSPMYQTV